jgi:hypothetical protein
LLLAPSAVPKSNTRSDIVQLRKDFLAWLEDPGKA